MALSVPRERQGATSLVRSLAWVVLALMLAAGAYAVWIALANSNRIGV